MDLIFDRTSLDVQRWRTLHDIGWEKMTEDEKSEWMGQMKGRYAHTDMNRVENATQALSERLTELGYRHPTLTVKTNWAPTDLPTVSDMERYLGNIAILKQSMPVYSSTPYAPTVAHKLDYNKANDLEKILFNIDEITTNIPKSWFYSGDVFAGEV